jgi:hypothetical protein
VLLGGLALGLVATGALGVTAWRDAAAPRPSIVTPAAPPVPSVAAGTRRAPSGTTGITGSPETAAIPREGAVARGGPRGAPEPAGGARDHAATDAAAAPPQPHGARGAGTRLQAATDRLQDGARAVGDAITHRVERLGRRLDRMATRVQTALRGMGAGGQEPAPETEPAAPPPIER